MVKCKQLIAITLAAGLGIAASGAASAQGMPQGGQGGMGPGMMMGGQGGMGPCMMMGGQGGMGPGMMMGGQGGMGPGMMMGGQGGMGSGMMGNMAEILDEEQLSSLREMRQEHRSAQFERMGEMMNLRDDMMSLMRAERPDPEEVKALHGQMATLRGEMMADKVRMHNQMQDLLTDEQREQMQRDNAAQ
ncbi:periplasmic heavy metal sensor [Halomonas sp. ZH2S]|uniref:Signaling pathway modulator ZraP n=1 Tax=Vreelandella zhuhanensis TaxID=2684210 RepID=A0A7X3KQP3_9GAMM|nr:periplasmic heavy metal sensor [Halomonas zhuhanensis]MWJ28123.1 periplasmic heavy metal sensor [Halomonas zhuhanensis]